MPAFRCLPLFALVPAVRGDHVRIAGVWLARALAAVCFDDVELVARRFVALGFKVSHVIGHEPEAGPGADGVGTDEPAFDIAWQARLESAAVVLERGDQPRAVQLVAGPDPQISLDATERVPGRFMSREDVDAEILMAVGRLMVVVPGLWIGARYRERSVEIVREGQRHPLCRGGRILGQPLVPGNAPLVVDL